MILSNAHKRLFFHMRVDGVGQSGTYVETVDVEAEAGLYQTGTSVATLNLSANQTVDIKLGSQNAYGSSYANFNGYFIG